MTDRAVHFVYLGGPFLWQNWRAIETAKVHDAQITLWYAGDESVNEYVDDLTKVRLEPLDVPAWLLDHPIQLANVKDLYVWQILYEQGGLYLDLDTISLRPAWDLLSRDVCVSLEHEPGFELGHPYNSAVVLGRKGAPLLETLAAYAHGILASGESRWGKCGPHLLTEFVGRCPEGFDVAPFGTLNGWRDDTIHRYYEGERPGPDVRVAHLFSSSRPDLFAADYWMP